MVTRVLDANATAHPQTRPQHPLDAIECAGNDRHRTAGDIAGSEHPGGEFKQSDFVVRLAGRARLKPQSARPAFQRTQKTRGSAPPSARLRTPAGGPARKSHR